MWVLHFVKLMKPLLMTLEFFGLLLLLQIVLLLKLPFRFWILVAHGFREWVQSEISPIPAPSQGKVFVEQAREPAQPFAFAFSSAFTYLPGFL
jgi:hypothetical protein